MPSPGEDYQVWSKTAANNGTVDPSIDWHEGQTRASVNDSSRSELAAHAKNRDLLNGSIVTTGAPNIQNFLSGCGYTSMPPRLVCRLKVGGGLTNTGPMTLNCDGNGTIQVVTTAGATLRGGEFVENQFVDVAYNGINWILFNTVINNPILTGDPQAPTPSNPLDNDTSIATTQWVQGLVYGGAGIVLAQKVFTANGTWTPSAQMKSCIIEVVGGGGGGGSAAPTAGLSTGGGGGGGGGYARRFATATEMGASQAVTIGAGGIGGYSTLTGGNGGTGFPTSVGSLCSANGGIGGTINQNGGMGGFGGGGTAGNFFSQGDAGEMGSTDANIGAAGSGGGSFFGGGGLGGSPSTNGNAGGPYGGGGGGAHSHFSAVELVGGPGSAGVAIITEFAGAGLPGATGPQGPVGPQGPSGTGGVSDADYLVRTAHAGLSAERVVTDTTTIIWDWTTAGQAKAQHAALTGDVTTSLNGVATTIANNAVTNAKLASVATATFKGRTTSGTGNVEDLTATQATALLNVFSSTLKGLVPASGGGTTNFMRADGTWAAPPGGGGGGFTTVVVQRFTTSGTYTPTASMKFCEVICIGGGAGGGGASGAVNACVAGGGGGSGGYSRKILSAATVGASQTVTIGAGGAGGAMAGTGIGAAGGTTSFGTLCIANGGNAALPSNLPGSSGFGVPGAGASPVGAVGDLTAPGGPGGAGNFLAATGLAIASGAGGNSALSGGGVGVFSNSAATAGTNASGYGGGGSGACAQNIAATADGGAGAPGLCVITEFI